MRNLLYIAVFTTVIVISWVMFGLYHNSITSTISDDTKIIITPIPGKFDDETVKKIVQRRVVGADLSSARASTSATQSLPSSPIEVIPSQPASSSAAL